MPDLLAVRLPTLQRLAPRQQGARASVEVEVEGHEHHTEVRHSCAGGCGGGCGKGCGGKREEPHSRPRPRPTRPAEPRHPRTSRSDKDRIELIVKTGAKVDRAARGANHVMTNIGLQTELGAYAHERGVFPHKLIPYLYNRLDNFSHGVHKAAVDAAFTSVVAFEGTRSGRGQVYKAVKGAIDYGADAVCDVEKKSRLVRASIDALDKLSRTKPAHPCRDDADEV